MRAQVIVQARPRVGRARPAAEHPVRAERAPDLVRPIARHGLRRDRDEPFAARDPGADVDARRLRRTEEQRRLRIAPFVDRHERAFVVERGEVEIVDRRRRARVGQDAGVVRKVDERAEPLAIDGLARRDQGVPGRRRAATPAQGCRRGASSRRALPRRRAGGGGARARGGGGGRRCRRGSAREARANANTDGRPSVRLIAPSHALPLEAIEREPPGDRRAAGLHVEPSEIVIARAERHHRRVVVPRALVARLLRTDRRAQPQPARVTVRHRGDGEVTSARLERHRHRRRSREPAVERDRLLRRSVRLARQERVRHPRARLGSPDRRDVGGDRPPRVRRDHRRSRQGRPRRSPSRSSAPRRRARAARRRCRSGRARGGPRRGRESRRQRRGADDVRSSPCAVSDGEELDPMASRFERDLHRRRSRRPRRSRPARGSAAAPSRFARASAKSARFSGDGERGREPGVGRRGEQSPRPLGQDGPDRRRGARGPRDDRLDRPSSRVARHPEPLERLRPPLRTRRSRARRRRSRRARRGRRRSGRPRPRRPSRGSSPRARRGWPRSCTSASRALRRRERNRHRLVVVEKAGRPAPDVAPPPCATRRRRGRPPGAGSRSGRGCGAARANASARRPCRQRASTPVARPPGSSASSLRQHQLPLDERARRAVPDEELVVVHLASGSPRTLVTRYARSYGGSPPPIFAAAASVAEKYAPTSRCEW